VGDKNANNRRNEKGSKRDKIRRVLLQVVGSGRDIDFGSFMPKQGTYRNPYVGNIKASKINVAREVGDKIHPMLLAFVQSCRNDRQQRTKSNVYGFLW